MNQLPRRLQVKILSYIDVPYLSSIRESSKYWYHLVNRVISNLVPELQKEIVMLKQTLHDNHVFRCEMCLSYMTKWKHCFVCRYSYCNKCVKKCNECGDYYCGMCVVKKGERGNEQPNFHVSQCRVCNNWHCCVYPCDFCHKLVCHSCHVRCVECHCDGCSQCLLQCPRLESGIKCFECHFSECGQCWQPEHFWYLSDSVRESIETLLLVFKRLNDKLSVPPRYVRYQIFRELIHTRICLSSTEND